MTQSSNVATLTVRPAPAGLEQGVATLVQDQAAIRRQVELQDDLDAIAARVAQSAAARIAALKAAAPPADEAAAPKPRRQARPAHKARQVQQPKAQPAQNRYVPSHVRLGLMAERAWERLSPIERNLGLSFWKLAALANLRFIPVPASRLESFAGHLQVHKLVRPGTATGEGEVRTYGWAFMARPTPGYGQALEGVKVYDHEGHVLAVAGQAPLAEWEPVSKFSRGVLNDDRIPKDWVYRRAADKQPDAEITAFILASLPLRQSL